MQQCSKYLVQLFVVADFFMIRHITLYEFLGHTLLNQLKVKNLLSPVLTFSVSLYMP